MRKENYRTIDIENITQFKIEIEKIKLLNKEDYIFRGHEDAAYKLQPSAFREREIKESWARYAMPGKTVQEWKEIIVKEWFESDEVAKYARLEGGIKNYSKSYLKALWFTYRRKRILTNEQLISFKRLLWHVVEIMRYNYDLKKFFNDTKNYATPTDRKRLASDNYTGGNEPPDTFFRSKQTFLKWLPRPLPVDKYDLETGDPIMKPYIMEGRTAFDESFAQHYGLSTASLDWTYNWKIALYFSTKRILESKKSGGILISEKIPPRYFSLYHFYIAKNNEQKSYVRINTLNEGTSEKNPRMHKQEGALTHFTNTNTFYLTRGNYPTMEDYILSCKLNVIKYNIRNHPNIIQYIENILNTNNINSESLGLGY